MNDQHAGLVWPDEVAGVARPGWAQAGETSDRLGGTAYVDFGGIRVPATFQLDVFPRAAAGAPLGFLVSLLYYVADEELTLAGVLAFGTMEPPAAIDFLRSLRSMDWWKRQAWMSLATKDIDRKVREEIEAIDPWGRAALGTGRLMMDAHERADADARARAATFPLARRRNRITPAFLREVADVYREAYREGMPPTVAVKEHFGTTHSTAARWVMKARESGHLGPAQGAKGGEAE